MMTLSGNQMKEILLLSLCCSHISIPVYLFTVLRITFDQNLMHCIQYVVLCAFSGTV